MVSFAKKSLKGVNIFSLNDLKTMLKKLNKCNSLILKML